MNFQRMGEMLSLGLTIPTLILSGAVVYFWYKSVKMPQEAHDWFILGVVCGFIGSFLDNLYWLFPWTASFLGLEIKEYLVNKGVYFNIFFRQMLGITAAYCHLKAAEMNRDPSMAFLNRLLFVSSLGGVIYSCIILYFHVC